MFIPLTFTFCAWMVEMWKQGKKATTEGKTKAKPNWGSTKTTQSSLKHNKDHHKLYNERWKRLWLLARPHTCVDKETRLRDKLSCGPQCGPYKVHIADLPTCHCNCFPLHSLLYQYFPWLFSSKNFPCHSTQVTNTIAMCLTVENDLFIHTLRHSCTGTVGPM